MFYAALSGLKLSAYCQLLNVYSITRLCCTHSAWRRLAEDLTGTARDCSDGRRCTSSALKSLLTHRREQRWSLPT